MKRKTPSAVPELFAGREASRKLFEAVRSFTETLGPVTIEVTKTQVSFGVKTKFAWVWLPQMWIKKAPGDGIVLTVDLPRRVRDKRIRESLEPYPGRYTHHIAITGNSDFDNKVKDWLREAYSFGASDRRHKTDK